MKIVIPLILFSSLAGSAVMAADPQTVDDSKPVDTRPQQSRSQQEHEKTTRPEPTFTPSEKVGADSAVAFPVDI